MCITWAKKTSNYLKNTVFWVVPPCSSEAGRRFGGAYSLHLHHVSFSYWFLTWLTLRPWRWSWYVPPKRRAVSELHGVTTWKTALLLAIAVKTSRATSDYLLTNKELELYLRESKRGVWRCMPSTFRFPIIFKQAVVDFRIYHKCKHSLWQDIQHLRPDEIWQLPFRFAS
jgi:hypothetical protein